ncbi:MAG: hypothetical protein WAO98_07235 [Alphaproteobacteria bacterium]
MSLSVNPSILATYAVALLQRTEVSVPLVPGMAGSPLQPRGTVATRRSPTNGNPVASDTLIAAQLAP